ncbi:hypothetical protein [Flindersiella endophytica]
MTDQARVEPPPRMPGPVLAAAIVVLLQVLAGLLGAAPFLAAVTAALLYLQDDRRTLVASGAISFLIGVLLAVGAAAMGRGRYWGAELVVLLEILVFVVGLLGLVVLAGIDALDPTAEVGHTPVVVGVSSLVIPVVVCGLLATRVARNWLV